jgi:NAD(P)-dependent dehydrogenase (short-subunit alcohol dehydrogenase family)
MSTTALITGGTSGIGRAVANKLAQLGILALVVGRNEERGEKTIAEIRAAGGQADFISSDLRVSHSCTSERKRRDQKDILLPLLRCPFELRQVCMAD